MTIGRQIKWDFETNGDLKVKDKNGKHIVTGKQIGRAHV